jgi:hypothetical protein
MIMRGVLRFSGCAVLLLLAPVARAALPTPLDISGPFGFPGAFEGPPSAAAAGCGLADLWLGDEPYGNPAAAPGRRAVVSPLFLHLSRQDLRARNRQFDETAGFLDAAGAALSWPIRSAGLSLYAWQPVLRREDNAYTRVPPDAPATIKSTTTTREVRAGVAASLPWRTLRLGLAGEWTRRDDAYDLTETSGSPTSGVRHADLAGDGFGFQAGVRWAPDPRVVLGAATRYVPAMDLDGSSSQQLILGTASSTVTVRRGSGWEAGLSARASLTAALGLLVGLGTRTEQRWEGFGVVAGRTASWSLGFHYHDPGTPWTLRAGVGQEQQSGVAEPHAGLVSLGLGWDLQGVVLDAAVLQRSFSRPGGPTSFDDRLVASATVPF